MGLREKRTEVTDLRNAETVRDNCELLDECGLPRVGKYFQKDGDWFVEPVVKVS